MLPAKRKAAPPDRTPQKQATLPFGKAAGLHERPANHSASSEVRSSSSGMPPEQSIKWHFFDPKPALKSARAHPVDNAAADAAAADAAAAPARANTPGWAAVETPTRDARSSNERQVSTLLSLMNRGKQRRKNAAGVTTTPLPAAARPGFSALGDSPSLLDCLRGEPPAPYVRTPRTPGGVWDADAPVDDLLGSILNDIARSTAHDIPDAALAIHRPGVPALTLHRPGGAKPRADGHAPAAAHKPKQPRARASVEESARAHAVIVDESPRESPCEPTQPSAAGSARALVEVGHRAGPGVSRAGASHPAEGLGEEGHECKAPGAVEQQRLLLGHVDQAVARLAVGSKGSSQVGSGSHARSGQVSSQLCFGSQVGRPPGHGASPPFPSSYPPHVLAALVLDVRHEADGLWLVLQPDADAAAVPAAADAHAAHAAAQTDSQTDASRPDFHLYLRDEWASTPAVRVNRTLLGLHPQPPSTPLYPHPPSTPLRYTPPFAPPRWRATACTWSGGCATAAAAARATGRVACSRAGAARCSSCGQKRSSRARRSITAVFV